MDRRTALERLDAVRPGSDDLARPEFNWAGKAFENDPSLAAEFERRQNWDRRIQKAMQDVPVPEGLQDRLMSSLASTGSAVAGKHRRLSRRRLLAASAGLAASLLAGGVFWASAVSDAPVAVADIRDDAAAWLDGRLQPAPFNGEFTPVIPRGALSRRLVFREPAVGLLESRVAAWQFQVPGRRPLRGVLAVVPASQVADVPESRSLSAREYVDDAKAVKWQEGELVYVCYVDGGIDELLHRLGSGPIA